MIISLLWVWACAPSTGGPKGDTAADAHTGSTVPTGSTSATGTLPTGTPTTGTDPHTGGPFTPFEPTWSLVSDGRLLGEGDAIELGTVSAGEPSPIVALSLTNLGSVPWPDPVALTGEAAVWVSPPPATLGPGASAVLELALVADRVGLSDGALVVAAVEFPLRGEVVGRPAVLALGAQRRVLRSEDGGLSWAEQVAATGDPAQRLPSGAVWYGGAALALVGDELLRSADAEAWSPVYIAAGGPLAAVGVLRDRVVVVGPQADLAWSADGQVWTAGVDDSDSTLRAAAAGPDRLVAVGSDRRAVTFDGETWAYDYRSPGVPVTDIVFGNGVFVVSGPTGALEWSEDGTRWNEVSLDGGPWSLAFGDDRFIATSAEAVAESDDGQTWDWVPGAEPGRVSMAWINSTWLSVQAPDVILRSDDLVVWSTVFDGDGVVPGWVFITPEE
ncbi:MAG: hypothetical protein ACI8PZ_000817 [Myxococcota bacterium]